MDKIIISKSAAPAEMTAAKELQAYLARMIGKTIPILYDQETYPTDGEIAIGVTNRAVAAVFDNADGFRIFSDGCRMSVCGGSPRGTLYGVYHFLEELGCRFFASDAELVPKIDADILDQPIDIFETPAFAYRDLFWTPVFGDAISAKLKLNGALVNKAGRGRRLSNMVGGGINYAGPAFVHTFKYAIPAERYFDKHPEYFSEINGVRDATELYSQICMTNEDVLDITVEAVKQWLRKSPDSRLVSVSQNDSFVMNSYCTCPKCQKVIDEEESPAGPLIRFVNAVAEAIEKDFPNVYVDTLAYQYSLKPPKITKARDNVVVRYCTGGCCSHPISECPVNGSVKQAVLGWKEVCPRMYIWDYTTNFQHYLCPFPNFRSFAPNAQFFHENKVIGVFEQGNYQEGLSGEFGELRSYLLAKLLWNPYADVEVMTDEFLRGYYGAAAPYIREYLDFMHSLFAKEHLILNTSPIIYKDMIREDTLSYYDRQWDKAKQAVLSDDELLARVERVELSYRYMKKFNKCREFAENDPDRASCSENKFYADCTRLGVARLSEGSNVPTVNPT